MSSSKAALPYSTKDVDYDNAKFRYRSPFKHTYLRVSRLASNGVSKCVVKATATFGRFWRKSPRLPPRRSPDEVHNASFNIDRVTISLTSEWISGQAKGRVNLLETTIRVLGGILCAYHLSGKSKARLRIEAYPRGLKELMLKFC